MKMTTTIASVNCYGGFLKTNPKILRTFFTYILEAQQFTLAKVTLNQVLSTQVNSSRLDKVQNMPVEKILSADFLSLEFVKSAECIDTNLVLHNYEPDLLVSDSSQISNFTKIRKHLRPKAQAQCKR